MPPAHAEQLIPHGGCASGAAHDCFLSSKQTRGRYADASDMWLWRRLHDDSGFPHPVVIAGRRFWRLSALIAWENSQAAKAEAA
jgi:hypothetical protein